MNEILTKEMLNKLLKKKEKSLFFYSLITASWLVFSLTLLFVSKREYALNVTINIIVTIIFGFYSVYYFTIIYKNLIEEIKLTKRIDNGAISKEYAYFVKLEEVKENKDVSIYSYIFKSLDNKERKLYSFLKIDESSDRYYIESKLDYIVSFKVLKDE